MHVLSWVPSLKRPAQLSEDDDTPSKRPRYGSAFGGSRSTFTPGSADARSDSAHKKQARPRCSLQPKLALSRAECPFLFASGGQPQRVDFLATAHIRSGAAAAQRLTPLSG